MFLFASKIKNKTDEATVVFLKSLRDEDPPVRQTVRIEIESIVLIIQKQLNQ